MRGRNYEEKIAKEGGSLNHLLSLQRYFWRYKITQGGGLNRNHKFSSSLYQDIIKCRKLGAKKANKGGSLNHLLSLQRYFLRYKITQGGGLNRVHKFSSSLYKDIEVVN